MEWQDRNQVLNRDLGNTARTGLSQGISIVPPMQDGSKSPLSVNVGGKMTWEGFQHEHASPDLVDRWYGEERRTGIGFVCGSISRGLELFEFDDREAYEAYKEVAAEVGLGELVDR